MKSETTIYAATALIVCSLALVYEVAVLLTITPFNFLFFGFSAIVVTCLWFYAETVRSESQYDLENALHALRYGAINKLE